MKHYVVKIYKSIKKINTDNLTSLEIGGRIGFLKNILLKNSKFLKENENSWYLNFFFNSRYEQQLVVKIIEIPANLPREELQSVIDSKKLDYKTHDELSTLSCIFQDCEMNSDIAEKLSLSIRGSKSIKCNDFIENPSHYHHVDGRGLSFFSRITNQEDNFKRQIILVSLAYAYLGAIEDIRTQLAEQVNDKVNNKISNIEELRKLYINSAKFNSTLFFQQPVLIKNSSLTEVWKKIDEALSVNLSSKELFEQLANVHNILELDADKKKQKIQVCWNWFFSILGIFIGILSLFELFK